MRILLTGATGFLGRHVLERLLADGHRVRVLVRAESRGRLGERASRRGVEVVPGELEDSALLRRIASGMDAVYHLALMYGTGQRFGIAEMRVNCRTTEVLVRAAVEGGAGRFIFASSVAAYGWYHPPSMWPLDEDAPLAGRSAYGRSKIESEHTVRDECQRNGIRYALLRLCPIYGPGVAHYQRFFALLRSWPRYCANPLRVLSPGLEHAGVSHWIHVRDAADCVVAAGMSPKGTGAINVAGPRAATRQELVALANRVDPPKTGRLRIYNTDRAKKMFGFTPKIRLAEGIEELLQRPENCDTF